MIVTLLTLHAVFGRAGRAVILALCAALVLSAASAHARPLDDIVEDGTIVIAVYRDFPPFSYNRDGTLAGIDVDLGRVIAERLGVAVSFMVITADENMDDDLRNAVWKGHYITREVADLMLHVPMDRQLALRNTMAAFFAPYFRREFALAYDPEWIGANPDPMVFTREKVGVELDSLPDFYLSSAYGGQLRENVVHYRTITEASQALVAGEVAAVMAPRSELEAGLGSDAGRFGFAPAAMTGFARSSWVVGVAVDTESRDLGYAVEDIVAAEVANGGIERIFAAHGISYRPPSEP
jgi:ABC-type amino acid transport substrate-binding protein